jgi:hypothetical protein
MFAAVWLPLDGLQTQTSDELAGARSHKHHDPLASMGCPHDDPSAFLL